METMSLAPPVVTVPSSVFCSVTVSFLQPGYMHGSTYPLSFLIGLYFFHVASFILYVSSVVSNHNLLQGENKVYYKH